jgi:peptide deformylase
MLETMCAPGRLAANQIVDLRLIVIDITGAGRGPAIIMANPVMYQEGVQKEEEGCRAFLTLPQWWATLQSESDRPGSGRQLVREMRRRPAARAFCHEIDHINGPSTSTGSRRFAGI